MSIFKILSNMAEAAVEKREEELPTWKTTKLVLESTPENTLEELEYKQGVVMHYLLKGDESERGFLTKYREALDEKDRISHMAIKNHGLEILNKPDSVFYAEIFGKKSSEEGRNEK